MRPLFVRHLTHPTSLIPLVSPQKELAGASTLVDDDALWAGTGAFDGRQTAPGVNLILQEELTLGALIGEGGFGKARRARQTRRSSSAELFTALLGSLLHLCVPHYSASAIVCLLTLCVSFGRGRFLQFHAPRSLTVRAGQGNNRVG